MPGLGQYLNKTVDIVIDRPIGSKHPEYGFQYPINYGFLPGTNAGDGEEIDAYIIGIEEPLRIFRGRCIAIVHRKDDNEGKLVVAAEGAHFTTGEVEQAVQFQEQFFKSEVIVKGTS
jgi:inorganic pyrophosphatase